MNQISSMFLSILVMSSSIDAFVPSITEPILPRLVVSSKSPLLSSSSSSTSTSSPRTVSFPWTKSIRPSRVVVNAGFGGSSNKKNAEDSKSQKDIKLKPKQQWDRYTDLKQETKIRVAVRVRNEDDVSGDEWLEVGRVKSKENLYTEIAVARQRALIAEVCMNGWNHCCGFASLLGGGNLQNAHV